MWIEQNTAIAEKPETDLALSELWDFTLEQIRCQELLPKIDGKQSFVFTKLLETICNWNPQAAEILNKTV